MVDLTRWTRMPGFSLPRVVRQATGTSNVRHPHIARTLAVFHSATALWVVQEPVVGCELFQAVVRGGALPEVRR